MEWQAGEDTRRVKLRVMGARRVIPGSKVVRWSCVVNLGSHRGLITHIATMKRLEERRVAVRLQHEDRSKLHVRTLIGFVVKKWFSSESKSDG